MAERPLVSICIASYNHEQYLPATLDSALAQTYRPTEVVIVDDGSTDKSLRIAETYSVRYPDIFRVFTHPGHVNRGISATVNMASQMSRGEYWSALGSDDVLKPDKLERQVRYLESRPDVGWVYSHADYIDAAGRKLPGLFGVDITRLPDPLARLIACNCIPGMTVLARRECIEKTGPLDEALIYSDWDLWLRMLSYFKAGFMNYSTVQYRVHGYNISVGITEEQQLDYELTAMVALREKALLVGGLLARSRHQSLINLQISYMKFLEKDYFIALQKLEAAFETDPSLADDYNYLASWLKDRCQSPYYTKLGSADFPAWLLTSLEIVLQKRGMRRLAQKISEINDYIITLANYRTGNLRDARKVALGRLSQNFRLIKDIEFVKILIKIFMKIILDNSVFYTRSSNQTGGLPTSGPRTGTHAFAHGNDSGAIPPLPLL